MKTILIRVSSTPDNPEYGYGDHFEIINKYFEIIGGGHCSTCPNPFSPVSKKTYEDIYGWISLGEYSAVCVNHNKYSKCFVVNGGKSVPCRYPNVNHSGEMILTEVMIHTGGYKSQNENWRGSAGCITIPPSEWDRFTDHFKYGEKVKLIIRNFVQNERTFERKPEVRGLIYRIRKLFRLA